LARYSYVHLLEGACTAYHRFFTRLRLGPAIRRFSRPRLPWPTRCATLP